MKRRLDAVLLTVAGVLFLLVGYERNAIDSDRKPSIFSTYDTGRNGYRALFEILLGAGVPVRRFEAPLGTLDRSIRTLIVSSYEFEDFNTAHPLDEHDAALLRGFVRNGGRLVAIDAEFAGHVRRGSGCRLDGDRRGQQRHRAIAQHLYRGRYARTRRDRLDISVQRTARHPADRQWPRNRWRLYRFGRGEVIAITAPALFSNARCATPTTCTLRITYRQSRRRGFRRIRPRLQRRA